MAPDPFPEHTASDRTRSRRLVLAGTALLTCSAFTATGAIAAALAEPPAADPAVPAAPTTSPDATSPATPTPTAGTTAGSDGRPAQSTSLPTRTVVSIEVVTRTAKPTESRVGGGSIAPATPRRQAPAAPAPAPAAPAPAPAPAPAQAPAPAPAPAPAQAPAPADTPSSGS